MSTSVHHYIYLVEVRNAAVLCRFDHHGNSFERIGASVELCPVDSILIAAAIVSSPIPHAVQVGVGTHVVPPASFLVMSAVTWRQSKAVNRNVSDTTFTLQVLDLQTFLQSSVFFFFAQLFSCTVKCN